MSLLLLANCSFSSRQPLCHERESSALLQFRDSIIVLNKSYCAEHFYSLDVYPKAASWSLERKNGSSDCCSWDGVECNHYTGHVISLDLSASCLYGSINSNSSLFRLLQLQRLNLAYNDFNSSQIPFGVGNLLSNNLRGLIPGWMYNVSKEALRILELSDNFLNGFEHSPLVLPWNNLEQLNLGNNMLQGLFPVPPPSIWRLSISNNSLSGFQQPLEMFQRSNLTYFVADNNRLQGSLPIPPPSIQYYQVRYNALTGAIPPIFCHLNLLLVLDLSNNNLSGMLHPCLGNLSHSLQVLGLRSNNFDGAIPNTWQKDCQLQMIDLSQNQLEGQMPRSLANCGYLEYLNVGNNRIKDIFPFWLKNLYQLKIFILHFNGFHGAASNVESNDSMLELHILDLSNNKFSGNLPVSNLLQSNAMKIVGAYQLQYMGSRVDYSITITNKGIELEYKKIKDDLTVIDFSCNRFEGEIPKLLGNLKGLRVLNLSNNVLTGPIPLSLGNLTQLESLDLSRNMLFGEIPGQLTQLSWLEAFNVSYNNFTGPIPHGNQFDTYENTSFEGNPELCGRPLSKMCENFEYSPIPPSTFGKDQSSESLFSFGWKIVVIGYGCGFVIGVIIGQLVIARHPNWFIKTFGKKQQLRRRRVNLQK
ncbi:Receptor-like protein 12 [Morella rubra]|uniref:Receptor-like protein 12 n=1 Tax=Morella rubra TaxID=262757 RepID=A0A6A1WLL7_9ROSI|nr:Receptor-like protein 12 [Morella rubra]